MKQHIRPLGMDAAGHQLTLRQWLALAVPPVLTVTMFLVFKLSVRRFGNPLGYLAAFLIYWIAWCLLVPTLLLGGWRQVLSLFARGKQQERSGWKTKLLLLWPLPFPILFRFLPQLSQANVAILAVSALLGVVIGVTEELLWRGVYLRLFPTSIRLNTVYPSVMFALWHVAPQAVHSNPSAGGVASFLFYALLLGLSYATHARNTGSIRGCTLSHCIHDVFGLGGFAYAVWLT